MWMLNYAVVYFEIEQPQKWIDLHFNAYQN